MVPLRQQPNQDGLLASFTALCLLWEGREVKLAAFFFFFFNNGSSPRSLRLNSSSLLCLSRSCWHVERRQPCDRWRSPTNASTSWTFRLPWPVNRRCSGSSSGACTANCDTTTSSPTSVASTRMVLAGAAWRPSKLLAPLTLPAVTDGGPEGFQWDPCCRNQYILGVPLRSGKDLLLFCTVALQKHVLNTL